MDENAVLTLLNERGYVFADRIYYGCWLFTVIFRQTFNLMTYSGLSMMRLHPDFVSLVVTGIRAI